jgi:gamma-glutamylcyclotransferase
LNTFYFAYGSNMNPDRVVQRAMRFSDHFAGTLRDYRLAFNKASVNYPGAASANVVHAPGEAVEGVLYQLVQPDEIERMDPFEGYPHRYGRQLLAVNAPSAVVEAWVYIAHPDFVVEGLKPNRWYLEHLLRGRPYLSPEYLERLVAVACRPDSDVES